MSFILEALKKSEQERRRERVPDLRTLHQPLTTMPRRSRWRWAAPLLIATNLALIGAAIWWWLPWSQSMTDTPESPRSVARSESVEQGLQLAERHAAAGVGTGNATAPAAPAPGVGGLAEQAPLGQDGPGTSAASTVATPLPVQPYAELAPAVRERLPAMTFSFHVYSANPDRRSIIINDRRLREGEPVGNGVALLEITQEGVILGMDQHRIYLPVLEQW